MQERRQAEGAPRGAGQPGSDRTVVILDGTTADDRGPASALAVLADELARDGVTVQIFSLRDLEPTDRSGTTGHSRESLEQRVPGETGRGVAGAILRSETTVLFTPITFGGFSSELKRMVDRLLPLLLPYFGRHSGETHQAPHFQRSPRLVGVGVLPRRDDEASRFFKTIVGRIAIGFHAPNYAADVVLATDGTESLRKRFRTLLRRVDDLSPGEAQMSLLPALGPAYAISGVAHGRHALLIECSPDAEDAGTSGVLGGHLLALLSDSGWQTRTVTLQASGPDTERLPELLATVDWAHLLILAFPLHVDALPFMVTRMFELISAHRREVTAQHVQRMVALCDNGSPAARPNGPALALCHQFAAESGIVWAGGLSIGSGKALNGVPRPDSNGADRLPYRHVLRALDLAAAALTMGQPVPTEAVKQMARSPVPGLSMAARRWFFTLSSSRHRWHGARRDEAGIPGMFARGLASL